MRLNRFLASAGLGSRRSCENLISEGSVTINGRVCVTLATEVKPEDHVKVGNKLIHVEKPTYVILNKPRGYVTTMSDEFGRRTIEDLLPRNWPRLFHVGRLDMDSEGLLLLTNDGELAQKLTHPRHKIEKEYEVLLDKPYDSDLTPKLHKGMVLEQGRAKIERLQIVKPNHLRVVLAQGLKRQIRLMFAAIDYEVVRLCRTRMGPIRLGALPSGSYRLLTDRELRLIHEHLNQKPVIERIRHADAKVA